jgi:hypothetical protein
MATTRTADETSGTDVSDIDRFIRQDPNEFGRHYARFVESWTPVHPVLNALRRTTGRVEEGDVAEVAREWHLSEDAVRAAIGYYQQNRQLWDAYFLIQDEESDDWNNG